MKPQRDNWAFWIDYESKKRELDRLAVSAEQYERELEVWLDANEPTSRRLSGK